LNQQLQNIPFASFSPLKTEHCKGYMLTAAPIIDFYMFWSLLPRNVDERKFNYQCTTVVTFNLTIDKQTEYMHICY
jgi:hypothetical protein